MVSAAVAAGAEVDVGGDQGFHVGEGVGQQVRREAAETLGEFGEEAVGVLAAEVKRTPVGAQQLLFEFRRGLGIMADPEQATLEDFPLRQDVQQGVRIAAVAGDDPGAFGAGVADNLPQALAVPLKLVFGVEGDEAGMLAVEVEEGAGRDMGLAEAIGGGQIVDRREEACHCAGADQQGVEIDGEHPVDLAAGEQLGEGQVGPVDARRLDVAIEQLPALHDGQLAHDLVVVVALGYWDAAIGRLELFADLPDQSPRQGNASALRAASAYQRNASTIGVSDGLDDIFDFSGPGGRSHGEGICLGFGGRMLDGNSIRVGAGWACARRRGRLG